MNRTGFFDLLPHLNQRDLTKVQRAYWLSKNGHRTQSRDGGIRYFEHVRGVSVLLILRGFNSASVVIKALLHDLTEDTHTPADVIRLLFGKGIENSISTLSKVEPVFDPKTGNITGWVRKPDHVYYAGLAQAEKDVKIVKCADRLHNLQSMKGIWKKKKQQEYADHTREYVLPIAYLTDPSIALDIDRLTQKILTTR